MQLHLPISLDSRTNTGYIVIWPVWPVFVYKLSDCGFDRSRTAATSKMEHFVILINGWKLLTIITKSSILDAAAVLDPPLPLQSRNCS